MSSSPLLPKELSKAGRALADLSQRDLAALAHVSESTVRDFEKGRRVPSFNNLMAIKRALEDCNVEFTSAIPGECGPGVRINRRSEDRGSAPAPKKEGGRRQTDNPFEKMHALLVDLQEKKKTL